MRANQPQPNPRTAATGEQAVRQADWLLRYALDLEPTRTEHPGYRSHLTSAVVQSRAAIALLDLHERL